MADWEQWSLEIEEGIDRNDCMDEHRTTNAGLHHRSAARARGAGRACTCPIAWAGGLGGDADLAELARLVDTAGADVVGQIEQRRTRPAPRTFLGKGKLEELKELVEDTEATLVVFDNDLSPAQGRNLEKALDVNVLDRTELILDIFANHASTRQARLQVELAQLQYLLPRLTRLWSHLERQAGGIGTRGPGETQLETDRRLLNRRIATLQRAAQGDRDQPPDPGRGRATASSRRPWWATPTPASPPS